MDSNGNGAIKVNVIIIIIICPRQPRSQGSLVGDNCINLILFDVVRYFGQFLKRGSRDRNRDIQRYFSDPFMPNKGVPSHSPKVEDTT